MKKEEGADEAAPVSAPAEAGSGPENADQVKRWAPRKRGSEARPQRGAKPQRRALPAAGAHVLRRVTLSALFVRHFQCLLQHGGRPHLWQRHRCVSGETRWLSSGDLAGSTAELLDAARAHQSCSA